MPRTASDLLLADEARSARAQAASAGREARANSYSLTDPALAQLLGSQSKSGAVVNEGSALSVATFGACVNILASSMANFPLRLMRDTGMGAAPAKDHSLYDIVGAVWNESMTSYRGRSFKQACLCLGGNGYTRIRRNRYFEIESLEPLMPMKMQPRLYISGPLSGQLAYNYGSETLLPQDVLHVRGLSTDGLLGMSPIRALRESIGLSLTMQTFTSRTFANGNRQPGVLEGSQAMNGEKAKAFYNDYTSLYAGAENAGKSPFIWGGVTWKNAGFTNQDAELLLNRNFEKSEIAGWFRIPEVLLGNTEKTSSWGTGIEQLTRGFVTFTLAPWATNWEQEMNLSLLTADERKAGYFFKFDFSELLRGSLTEQSTYLKNLWGIGAVTANEVRRVFHLEERADGPANLTYVPSNFVESGTQPATAQAAPAASPAEPADDGKT